MRRKPATTRNSGAAFAASAAHAPPLRRIASSRIVGAPASTARRSRISWARSPSHVSVRTLSAIAAVRPGAALYPDKLQTSGSADAAAAEHTNAIAATPAPILVMARHYSPNRDGLLSRFVAVPHAGATCAGAAILAPPRPVARRL